MRRLGIEGDWKSPEVQEQLMRAYTADSQRALEKAGLPSSGGNLYALHLLGQGGGPKLLLADDAAPATSIVGNSVASANRGIFYNGDGTPRTVAQVKAVLNKGYVDDGTPTQQAQPTQIAQAQPVQPQMQAAQSPQSYQAAMQSYLPPQWTLEAFNQLFAPPSAQQQTAEDDPILALARSLYG